MFQENEIHSFERKKRKFRDNPIDQNIPKLPTGCCIDRKDLFAIRHPHPSPRNDFAWVSYRDKRIWTARATRKHGGRRKKKIGRGGGEVELRGQTKNRVTTIIAVPGRKVSSLSLSLCVFGAMADRQECRLGRDVETRRGGGQGKVFVAEGVLKVFAEQIHEEAGN